MKKTITFLLFLVASNCLLAQFVTTLEPKEPIEGLCDSLEIYSLHYFLDGQEEPVCPLTNEELMKLLNEEVSFLKNNPKFKASLKLQTIVNCEGKLVKCSMDSKSRNEALDEELITVFNQLGNWKSGKLYGEDVNSVDLWSIEIRKGTVISLN